MSFPQKSWFGTPKGWKDLGTILNFINTELRYDGEVVDTEVNIVHKHKSCRETLNIGKESDGTLFRFCPRCEIKVE